MTRAPPNIRLLLDLIHPTSGRTKVLGMDTRTHSVPIRRLVGYVPGELGLYENLTGRELLTYLANLRGRVEQRRVDELAERLELDLHQHVHDLSKGNKQKLGLLQAFMHRPELLVLDEPTSGLDPLVQQEFHRLVGETTAAGGTVFLSSHMLSEVEHLAHRVAIVREGRPAVVEEVTALKARALRRLELDFARPVPAGAFTGVPGVRELVVDDTVLRCAVEGSVDAMLKAAARFEVLNVVSHEPDLEEIFLAYYRKDASDAA